MYIFSAFTSNSDFLNILNTFLYSSLDLEAIRKVNNACWIVTICNITVSVPALHIAYCKSYSRPHFRIGLISLDGGYSVERLALRTFLPKLTDILTFENTYELSSWIFVKVQKNHLIGIFTKCRKLPNSKNFKIWCRISLPDGFLKLVPSEII